MLEIVVMQLSTITSAASMSGDTRCRIENRMDVRRRVGLNIKKYRLELGLSQEELAFHHTYISGAKRYEPPCTSRRAINGFIG